VRLRRLLRSGGYLRRRVLVARVRWAAWLEQAEVDIELESGVWVGRRVRIEVRGPLATVVRAQRGTRIGDGVLLRLRGGELRLGPDVDVRSGAVLSLGGGRLAFDGPNLLGWGSVVHCAESVHLARHAYTGELVTFVDSSHFHSAPDEWSYHNSRSAPIEVGEDAWVCSKATVTSGVTIGSHAIVGSSSVVTKDVPAGVLVSGIPATVVRSLGLPWIDEASS